jgi:glycosyltransferase involved in cell wall biosynthesis
VKIAIVSGDDVVGDDSAQLSAALAARGHDVTAYVRQRDRRGSQRRTDRGYRIVSVRVGPGAVRSAADVLPYAGDWATALERLWSSDQPDIVHAYGWLGGLAAQLAARRRGRPVVQTFQGLAMLSRSYPVGSPPDDTEREQIERLLARNAGWATVESSSELEVLARLRRSRERVSVLTGGVDVEQYTPVGPALDRSDLHRILCLASDPLLDNGFDTLVRALPRVPATELVVAETDPTNRRHDAAREQLHRLAAELGVAGRIRLLGTVLGDELPKLIRSADVLACAPRRPPRASAALQAMASGVAVVGVPVGVLTDLIVADVTGVVLSTDNPGEFATSLRSLVAQSFRRKGLGAAGRRRALSRYTWDRVALDSLTIYGRLSPQSLPTAPHRSKMKS